MKMKGKFIHGWKKGGDELIFLFDIILVGLILLVDFWNLWLCVEIWKNKMKLRMG